MPYYSTYRAYRRQQYRKKRQRIARRTLLPAEKAFFENTALGEVPKRGSEGSIAYFGKDWASANEKQRQLRKAFRFRGAGAYSVDKFVRDAAKLGEGIKKTYNAWLPKSIRDQLVGISSNALRNFAGSGLYTGRGAYSANELVRGGMPSMAVGGSNDETETIVISNREYITDVYGPGSPAFTNQALQLNPGLQQNFPWLSQIAINYEEYDFQKLVFEYRSTIDIGNANTTGQSGSIIMVCDYNASHPLMDTKEAMMQYHGAVSGKATDDLVCGIECDPSKTNMNEGFVRSAPVPYGEDIKTYDHGLFQYAIVNIPTAMQNQQLGELWVEYTCRLRKPKLATSRGFSIQQDMFVAGQSAWNGTLAVPAANALGPSRALPLGSDTVLLSGRSNNIGSAISFPAANQFRLTFPASLSGSFLINYRIQMYANSTNQSGDIAVTFTGNVNQYQDIYGGGQGTAGPGSKSIICSNGGLEMETHIKIQAATGGINNTVTYDLTGITQTLGAAGAGYWRMASVTITELNPQFATSNSIAAPQLLNPTGVITTPAYY